ncbi:hypothetical protein ABC389_09430 [Limosilactobacillus sp. WILCCON 0053]|uniref:Lreu_0056 family protein n=1 Tax=Limosilactobacillus allomucosae TaxID=3142938 RepID=UPI003266751C
MKKSIIMISALMSCFLLTACGSQSSSSSKESNSTAAQSSTAKSSSSQKSSQSDNQIQKASSSSDSSSSASSTAKTAKVDDKTTGVMLALLVEPDWFKEYIGNDFFCYSPAGENPVSDAVADYSYLTANGDPTSFIYYKVDGNNVTYKMWEVSDSQSVADGHFETKTVSLSTLINDYYVTQSQRDEVNSYVSQLRSESDYLNQNQ